MSEVAAIEERRRREFKDAFELWPQYYKDLVADPQRMKYLEELLVTGAVSKILLAELLDYYRGIHAKTHPECFIGYITTCEEDYGRAAGSPQRWPEIYHTQ